MENNNILSKYQSGFRKQYSCETAVNYVINRRKINREILFRDLKLFEKLLLSGFLDRYLPNSLPIAK